jgi:hypothetical protein
MLFGDAALDALELLRVEFGYPMVINSGYRCPSYDAQVHKWRDPGYGEELRHGPHTVTEDKNLAVDVKVSGALAYKLIGLARVHGFTGIGISQRGDHEKRFIHLDRLHPAQSGNRPRPTVWSY